MSLNYLGEGRPNTTLKDPLEADVIFVLARSGPRLIQKILFVLVIIHFDVSSYISCKSLAADYSEVSLG